MTRLRAFRVLVPSILLLAAVATAQSSDPVAVVLMTGFNPGANSGMDQIRTRLEAEFGGSGPPFSSQVFAYTNQSGAANFLSAAGSTARRVLIGHSWGANSNFTLAQNVLGPAGMTVHLQISVDWVSTTNPFSATTPTVPPSILLAYNYHQTSTQILEPVPSHTIIGAARNWNLEFVFEDATIVHTSIDNDPRVEDLVVARIRELIEGHPYAGTGEHVDLFCRIDGLNVACNPGSGIAVPGVLAQHAVQTPQGGDWVTLRTLSPEGDLSNALYGVLIDVFPTGAPPTPVLPGLASGLDPSSIFLMTPGALQVAPSFSFAFLPPTGDDYGFCWPAGLTGVSAVFQTVTVTPAAANGLYATSLGIELRG